MEQLGLGVRLDLDDNMTSEINPIIRDLERLRRQAQKTTSTYNDMRNAHNPFGRNKRQDIQDYYIAMQSTDRALLSVSDRLILATKSANSLSKAMNRAQFTGNFNMMYRDITRLQNMLGHMGYGMSKMQREMSNLRAYNIMDVQIKDLHDRIKLTTKALHEMQSSPDASKMTKEIDVAKRSLQAYQSELKRVGSLQNKLTETHGLGQMKSFAGAKDILIEEEKGFGKNVLNRVVGLMNTDLALASAVMAKSLTATEKALVGTGYTALETKKKVAQLTGAMMGLGTVLTTTVSLVSGLAMGGWGYLANNNEKMNAQFSGQTLTPIKESGQYQSGMREVFQSSSGSDRDSITRMFASMKNNKDMDIKLPDMMGLANGANEINYAWGGELGSVEVLTSAMSIAKETGASFNDTLDLLSLGLKETDGDLEKATETVLTNAGALKGANAEWKNAFETLEEGNRDGSINRLIGAVKGLSNVMTVLWDKGMKQVVGGFADLVGNLSLATDKFLTAHPAIAKFAGSMLGLALVTGLIVGPIILVTAFMTKFRSAIQGVGLAIQALSARGGVAVLGAQSSMLAQRVHGATVALARFPQTLLFGVIPALFSVIRMIPNFILNMARINPVMAGLTVGMIAYSQNWFGFGDSVKKVTQSVKDSVAVAKGAIGTAMSGGDVDMSSLSTFEQVLAKTMGTAQIAKDVIKSIFTGEELKFDVGETNLLKQLGIEGMVNSIAKAGKAVKDFTDGFVAGIQLVYDRAKTFVGWMVDTFEPVIVRIGNFISKLFGGSGDASSIEDIMNTVGNTGKTMSDLGKIAGVTLTALLGFKLLKPILDGVFKNVFRNPFKGLVTGAKLASNAVKGLGAVMSSTRRNSTNVLSNSTVASNTNARRGTVATPVVTGGNIITRTASRVQNVVRGYSGVRDVNSRGRVSTAGVGRVGRGVDFDNHSTRQSQANRNNLGVRHADFQNMNVNQRNNHRRALVNARARARGYDLDNDYTSARQGKGNSSFINNRVAGQAGTQAGLGNQQRQQLRAIHEQGTIKGSTVYQRRQNGLSRALFGQAYDRFDEQGRRRTVNRQGGLLRRSSNDLRVTDQLGVRDRATIATRRVMSNAGQATARVARQAGGAVAQTARMTGASMGVAGRQVVNSRAMKPITVPIRYINSKIVRPVVKPIRNTVRWVSGRLQTAGVIRQGQTAGRQSGSRFKRAFNMASRGLGAGGRMFNGAVRGAGSAGRKAGSGMIKGMNFMSKGISGIFKLGLKAIPFLGWALMAWDIISAIFTNWDSIKSGAQKAWEWIKTSGVSALQSAWESIKGFASTAWTWIKENGLQTATNIATGYISFLGQAWTFILGLAGQALAWILTDGIAKAMELGAKFIFWVATDAFPKIVSFAGSVLTGFISTAGSIAASIGSAMWTGITSALSGLGNWLGEQIAKVPGGSFVVEKLTGKKYARGGIINSPHMGIVGEAGPEVIIPLSGNQRNRASMLLEHTAGALGMTVQKVGSKDAEMPLQDVFGAMPNTDSKPEQIVRTGGAESVKLNQNVVRNANTTKPTKNEDVSSGDNSVTIQKLEININDAQDVTEVGARKHAVALAKEFQKLMKKERMRSRGKNLTLEEMILNL